MMLRTGRVVVRRSNADFAVVEVDRQSGLEDKVAGCRADPQFICLRRTTNMNAAFQVEVAVTKAIAAGRQAAGRRTLKFALAGALALGATGCMTPWPPGEDTLGGPGLPRLRWLDQPPIGGTAISGTIRIADNGCMLLEMGTRRLFVLWPDAFDIHKDDGSKVQTDSGHVIAPGDTVTGIGLVLRHDAAVKTGVEPLTGQLGYCARGGQPLDVLALTKVTAP